MVTHATEFNSPGHFGRWAVPILSDIPFIGPALFDGTIFLYGTYVLVIAVHFCLFHTRVGLRLRAVGDHPRAADTVGIDVRRTRMRAVLVGGVIAGLGGAFLVVGAGSSVTFSENMSSGMGYIALATVIFGRWTPRGAVLAALLFGFVSQLQSLLSQAGAPIDPNLLLTAPYIATLVAVVAFVGHAKAPAADGQPYFG
jgi:simple sugar transport system permease protein